MLRAGLASDLQRSSGSPAWPFDAVARADGLTVLPLGFGRVQERWIIGERHGQHAATHQLNRQGVG